MNNKMKYSKIKYEDGSYSPAIPIGVDAENVDFPDSRNLIQVLQNFVNQTDFETLKKSIANQYGEKTSYEKGDYCIHNNQLYCCINSISIANPNNFIESDWTVINAGDELINLKNILNTSFVSRFHGKKLSIIGDSIDTFNQTGYKIDGYAMYYPSQNVPSITSVEQTWWKKVINASGMKLEKNASWSGSRVTNTHPNSSYPDFYQRVSTSILGNPDVIFVTLGTNDSSNNVELGEYDFTTTYTDLSESTFRTAYIKGVKALQATYPNAEIVCISEQMKAACKKSIIYIANELNVTYIDASDYVGESGVHPGEYGMNQIAALVLYPTDASFTQKHIPADSKEIGDTIISNLIHKTVNSKGTIPANSDINTYRQPGVYTVTTDPNAETLSNWPDNKRGDLIVFNSKGSQENASYGVVQVAIIIAEDVYYRRYTSHTTGWSNWFKVAKKADVDNLEALISTMSSDMSDIEIPYTLYRGYSNADGGISTADNEKQERFTNYLYIHQFTTMDITIEYETSRACWASCIFYDKDRVMIGNRAVIINSTAAILEATVNIPSEAYYCIISFRKYDDGILNIKAKGNINELFSFANINNVNIYEVEKEQILNNNILLHNYDKIDYEEQDGYYTIRNGVETYVEKSSFANEANTGYINVNSNDKYVFTARFLCKMPGWISYILYDENKNILGQITPVKTPASENIDEKLSDWYSININIPNESNIKFIKLSYRRYDQCKANLYKDNSVTKEELTSLKEVKIPFNLSPGYIGPDGNRGSQSSNYKELITDPIFISEVNSIHVKIEYEESVSAWASYIFYTEDREIIDGRVVFIPGTTLSEFETDISVPSNAFYIILSFRSFDSGIMELTCEYNMENIYNYINFKSNNTFSSFSPIHSLIVNKPCYDHLFVNATTNAFIPHESIYHLNLSKRLGFDIVEINTSDPTTDGIRIANHLNNQKFGNYFHHIDGTTNISNIDIKNVSWDWIKENVRYNSIIEKYRTAPETVEEALYICKKNNLIPFINTREKDIVEMTNNIIGSGNYIAYGASRINCPTELIYHWVKGNSIEDIVNYCKGIGKPFCYGLSTPTRFSFEELKAIVDAVHSEGYLIGTSYVDNNWCEYRKLGFDLNGTQNLINRIDNGNLCNYNSILNFSKYNITGGTETNGILIFENTGTITPKIEDTIYPISIFDLSIRFKGSININAIGESQTLTITYQEPDTYFVSIPVFNGTPKPIINVSANTFIYDIDFKASIY